jgi:restriction system protein
MAIPDYQTLMLPLLKQLADGREHRLPEVRESLAASFTLKPEELEELLPSGTQRLFNNRIGWAQTYLKKAMLLDNPRRGVLVITERGKQILTDAPVRIDAAFLSRFPEFREFVSGVAQGERETVARSNDANQEMQLETPEELLETAHQTLRDGLASELLTTIKGNTVQHSLSVWLWICWFVWDTVVQGARPVKRLDSLVTKA